MDTSHYEKRNKDQYRQACQLYQDLGKVVEAGRGGDDSGFDARQQYRKLANTVEGFKASGFHVEVSQDCTYADLLTAAGQIKAYAESKQGVTSASQGCLIPLIALIATSSGILAVLAALVGHLIRGQSHQ